MDTRGLITHRRVHAANVQDREGAQLVLKSTAPQRLQRLEVVVADAAYRGSHLKNYVETQGWKLKVRSRTNQDDWTQDEKVHEAPTRGFRLLKDRWVVERSIAWLSRHRRLSKDYEAHIESSEAWIDITSIGLMVRRLAPH